MKMKKNIWIQLIMLAAVAMTSQQAVADSMPHDTVYFYNTWEQILYDMPEAVFVDPYMYPDSYEVEFETANDRFNESISREHIAASMGDSIWLINTRYLRDNFKGDTRNLRNYVPFFFNDKVAFVMYAASPSVTSLLFGDDGSIEVDYYYIDFVNRKVRRVTSSVLSELLEDYHDLQMRYEGMKDYKKRYIIEDFFFKYIDRATDDFMHPYILDLVE